MLPWIKLDETKVPGGDELKLMQRGTEFSIMSGVNELMNSRLSGSEQQLAVIAAERVGSRPGAKILIGGLGMGFTLRTALEHFGPDAEITIAELVPAVVDWARGPLQPIHGDSLDDPRVKLYVGDVAAAITAGAPFDAILLDVDNGPDGLSRPENDRLYSNRGIEAARAALTRGGHLAVWSAHPDIGFTRRLKKSSMTVEELPVRANGKRGGARHLIWVATKI